MKGVDIAIIILIIIISNAYITLSSRDHVMATIKDNGCSASTFTLNRSEQRYYDYSKL